MAGGRVCVSAGGGLVGGPLFRAAVEAAPALLGDLGLPTTIVTGPLLPADGADRARAGRRGRAGCTVVGFVSDLAAEMAASAVSVSQCGYNTAMDILAAGMPAVVVPYSAGREDEQLRRAQPPGGDRRGHRARGGRAVRPQPGRRDPAGPAGGAGRRTALRLDGARRTAELVDVDARRRLGRRRGPVPDDRVARPAAGAARRRRAAGQVLLP